MVCELLEEVIKSDLWRVGVGEAVDHQ
jgi:hypothetical protein